MMARTAGPSFQRQERQNHNKYARQPEVLAKDPSKYSPLPRSQEKGERAGRERFLPTCLSLRSAALGSSHGAPLIRRAKEEAAAAHR
jgi:hypothetical protein